MRVAMEKLDGQKMQMKKSKKLTIVAASIIAVITVSCFLGYSYHKKQIAKEALIKAEIAMNDSLSKDISKLQTEADIKFQNGNKHGEGYEQEYIDAYLCLSNAILSAKKMTKSDVNITGLTNKRDSVKKALIVAKEELEGKASDFADIGMEDIAEEFRNRSNKISNIIK